MKAANFLNILLAVALVLLCAKLHFMSGTGTANAASGAADAKPAAPAAVHGEAPAQAINATASGDCAETAAIDSTGLAPGVSGFGGPVPVIVEMRDGAVVRVSPKLPNDETPGFFNRLEEAGLWKAWDGLPAGVAATARVDAVTGATYSSEAAIANVRAALAVGAAAGAPGSPMR